MKLILAEKPELGRAIAEAIPASGRTDNAVIYKGDYAIAWAYGHLLTLKEPEDYDPALKKWTLESLPIFFPDWGQKPDEQSMGRGPTKAQRLAQIGKLLSNCQCVIHAGDPDDEGQYLIDEILRWHKYQGPVYRINTNDTTPAALRRALSRLEDNSLFENRGWSAHARSVADMMVGYNCSRYFTLKNPGTLLTIGRVQTATLGLVVLRDEAIENHVKQNYYEVVADINPDGVIVEARYEPKKDDPNLEDGRILDHTYAENKAAMLDDEELRKVQVVFKELTEQPPLPFNLTKLQSYCSTKFGYEPSEVLDITQTLRDKYNAITYNRSDCQYLSEEQFKEAPVTMQQVVQNISYAPAEMDMTLHSKCFDDSRISAHTAIIPQNKALNLNALTERERKVYLAICKYYMAQFLPPAKKGRTTLTAPLQDGGQLKAVSTVIQSPGFLKLFQGDKSAELPETTTSSLSSLKPGTYTANVLSTRIEEKQTKPPARYTKASLGEDMTRIARYVSDKKVKQLLLDKDKDKEGENGSIGTVATRPIIIDKLVERGYFSEQGKKLISTPLGRELYRILPDELKKPDMTAYWWAIQEDIQQGNCPWTKLTESVLEMIKHVVSTSYPAIHMEIIPDQYKRNQAVQRTSLGPCPCCGKSVIEGQKGYGCSGYREGCKFVIWKKSRLPMMAKTKITAANVKTWLSAPWERTDENLIRSTKSVKMKRLVGKSGTIFQADVFLEDDLTNDYEPNYRIQFPDRPAKERESLGICPRCGGAVRENQKGYGCSNWKDKDCKFTIWKSYPRSPLLKSIRITTEDVRILLTGGGVKKDSLTDRNGSTFTGILYLQDNPETGPNLIPVKESKSDGVR